MLDCARNVQEYTLEDVVLRVVGDLGIPVAYGLKSGHVSRAAFTLPFGVTAGFGAADNVTLTLAAPVKSEATPVPVRTS
jgi:muramoyltetrapeptide carboxypeptidase LdcA involved in peptidoglycan recycling